MENYYIPRHRFISISCQLYSKNVSPNWLLLTTSLFHFGPSPHHLLLSLSIEPPNQFPRFYPGNLSMSSKCGSQASSDNSQGTAGLSSAQILQRLEQAWETTARGHPTTLRFPKGSGSSPVSPLVHLLPPPCSFIKLGAPRLCTHLTCPFPHIPSRQPWTPQPLPPSAHHTGLPRRC